MEAPSISEPAANASAAVEDAEVTNKASIEVKD
jgi:hypothetical protein